MRWRGRARCIRPGERLTAPAPLDPATAAVLLTLVDNETPLWLDPAVAAARDWLAFHCGAAIVDAPGQRRVRAGAVAARSRGIVGRHARSAGELGHADPAGRARWEPARAIGCPGRACANRALLAVDGLPADFAAVWQRNHALYPRGVDIILCAGTTLAALPRSVSIEEA